MLNFNLEYYRAFYYVAKLGNMTKAAEALFISQPAVSRSIQSLENSLQTTLFVRRSHGMELTPEGTALYAHVEAAFEHLLSGEEEVKRTSRYNETTIRVAATETPLYHLLLPKIESFRQMYPHVHFQISGSSTEETIALLRDNRVDFALAVSPLGELPDLKILDGPVFRDVLVAGPEFSPLAQEVMTAEKLSAQPVIAVRKGTSARRHIDFWFQEQGVFFLPAFSVQTSSMVLPFVLRNLGIGILPEQFAREALERGRVIQLCQDRPFHSRQIYAVLPKSAMLPKICGTFLSHLLD